MPWDKIVGKMLFSHYTPDTVKAEKVETPDVKNARGGSKDAFSATSK